MSKPVLKPALSFASYLAVDALNFSTLKSMQVSERAFIHALTNKAEPTDEMEKGTALHTLLLEPDTFNERYAIWTGGRRAGKEWQAFEQAATDAGKSILRDEDADSVYAWAHLCQSDDVVGAELRALQQREMTATWTDAETGVKCKGRIDGIRPHRIIDLKTTRCQTPDHFEADAVKRLYPAQLAYYLDGVTGGNTKGWSASVIVLYKGDTRGQYPPDCWVMDVAEEVIEHGRAMYREWLRKAKELDASKPAQGIARGERKLMILPAWAESQLPTLSLTSDEGELIF